MVTSCSFNVEIPHFSKLPQVKVQNNALHLVSFSYMEAIISP
jgi:hypothetical protein